MVGHRAQASLGRPRGLVTAKVDGIILTVVTEGEDEDCAMGEAEAEEFLADWVRVYEELREMRDG
jgi:hypothetical protein